MNARIVVYMAASWFSFSLHNPTVLIPYLDVSRSSEPNIEP